MEKKTSVKDIHKLIAQDFPELYQSLSSKLGENNPFAKFSIGPGVYVWSDDRYQWNCMLDANGIDRSLISDALQKTMKDVSSRIGAQSAAALFMTPDDSYIYYYDDNGDIKILITGWGFKKPERVITRADKETIPTKNPISLSFSFGGVIIPDYEFIIKLPRQNKHFRTGEDGYYHISHLNVGEHLDIADVDSGKAFSLDVIKDKSDYDFDVTKFVNVNVTVTYDHKPLADENVSAEFRGMKYTAVTGSDGTASFQIPAFRGEEFVTTVRDQSKNSVVSSDDLQFVFEFEEEKIPEPGPVQLTDPPIMFTPRITVKRENGDIVPNFEISVEYDSVTSEYISNQDGSVFLNEMEVGKSIVVSDYPNKAIVESYTLVHSQEEYVFFVPDVDIPAKHIKVMFRDYQGYPIKCDYVIFNQKDRNSLKLQLDDMGDAYFKEGLFKVAEPVSVSINGWDNDETYDLIPFTLEDGEYEYLIQEKYPKTNWRMIVLQILIVLVSATALLCLWPVFQNVFRSIFMAIYY